MYLELALMTDITERKQRTDKKYDIRENLLMICLEKNIQTANISNTTI